MGRFKEEIHITWCIEDIIERARDVRSTIIPTRKQASEILCDLDHNYNSDFGISWDTIDATTQYYMNKIMPKTFNTKAIPKEVT